MADTIAINSTEDLLINQQDSLQSSQVTKGDTPNKLNAKNDVLFLAYLYILESVYTDHQTALIQAKQLETNATEQNKLIAAQNQLSFYQLSKDQLYNKHMVREYFIHGKWVRYPWLNDFTWNNPMNNHNVPEKLVTIWTKKSNQATLIAKFEIKNQWVSALLNLFQNKLGVARQDAQGNLTYENSEIDYIQQAISQGGGLMQMLVSLSNQISRI